MSEKKQQQQGGANEAESHVLCSPPSHPTTLGNVWVGQTQPSTDVLIALFADAASSEKTRNG